MIQHVQNFVGVRQHDFTPKLPNVKCFTTCLPHVYNSVERLNWSGCELSHRRLYNFHTREAWVFLCPSDAVTVNEKGVNGQSVVNTTIVQCLTVVTFIAYEKKKKKIKTKLQVHRGGDSLKPLIHQPFCP